MEFGVGYAVGYRVGGLVRFGVGFGFKCSCLNFVVMKNTRNSRSGVKILTKQVTSILNRDMTSSDADEVKKPTVEMKADPFD